MLTKTSYGLSTRKFKSVASIIAVSICSIATAWAQCSAPSVSGTTICAGQLANLQPNPAIANTSYDWYNAPTGGTLLQTANSFTPQLSTTTTYYVAARSSSCTSARTAVTVNVNPLPADGFFTVSPLSICQGDAITYSNVINTGITVTVTKPSTYTQIAGSCGSTSTSTGCSGTMSATGIFTATATTSLGCSKVFNQTVTVNPIPTVTLSANSWVCNSNPLSFTASTVAGATYSWTGPNNFTSITTSPTVVVSNTPTTLQKGTYTVKATVNGCTSQPATTSVNEVVNNTVAPVISSSMCFTPGVTAKYAYITNTDGYDAYSWTVPSNFTRTYPYGALSGGMNGTFAAAVSSQFSVYNSPYNCPPSPTTTFTIYPNPTPTITATKFKICKDETIQLVSNLSGGTWSISTSPLPALTGGATTNSTISTTGLFTGNNPGVFKVRYTATVNGCTGYSEQDITVGALPFIITGSNKMCQNKSSVYTVVQPGVGNSYSWKVYQNPNTPISTPSVSNFNNLVATLNTGYTPVGTVLNLSATGAFECIAAIGNTPAVYKYSDANILVTVVAAPSNLLIKCADGNCNQLTVVDKTSGQPATGFTYTWTFDNSTSQTVTNPKNNSSISCNVKNADGCETQFSWWPYSTYTCATGTVYDYSKAWYCNQNYTTTNCPNSYTLRKAEANKYELQVYPNPSKANISFLSDGLEGTATIYNMDGVVGKSLPLIKDETMYNVNISTLAAGMYVLRVISSNGESHAAPFIKE